MNCAFADVRCSAIRRKWRLVRSLRMVPQAAIPIAPPKLRISENRPLADFRRSGGSPPRVNVTVDADENGEARPRNASGNSISLPAPLIHHECEQPHGHSVARQAEHQ